LFVYRAEHIKITKLLKSFFRQWTIGSFSVCRAGTTWQHIWITWPIITQF